MVLLFFAVFMTLLVGLDVTNEIINNRIKNLDEVNSLNGVLTLFKTSTPPPTQTATTPHAA